MTISCDASRSQAATPSKRPSAAPRLLAELKTEALLGDGQTVTITLKALAERLGVSHRTVQRARGDLVACGFIAVTGPDERHAPNKYRILV